MLFCNKNYMKYFKNKILTNCFFLLLIISIVLLPSLSVHGAARVQETGDELVIVIDPGHGGKNEGTTENGFLEKSMTMITAQAMYEELLQYDDVQVYLTRTEDVDMSLKERAQFAAEVNADFLFSIHYNASANHTLFGSEVWIPSMPPLNAYGYQFGYCQMLEMQDMGLYLRGIKTRLNDKGTDYYGIIREAATLSIPAVIIEHCHVDEARDVGFCDTEEDWITFGKANARAVAKYFELSSQILQTDYSKSVILPKVDPAIMVESTGRDETPPDVCLIEPITIDYNIGTVTIELTATDYDSPMLYYDYSLDGGETFSPREIWPEVNVLEGTHKDTFRIILEIPSGQTPEIVVRAYNLADLYTESNHLPFVKEFMAETENAEAEQGIKENTISVTTPKEDASQQTSSILPANAGVQSKNTMSNNIMVILEIGLIAIIILLIAILTISMFSDYKHRKKRHQRRNDAGNNKNQPR